MELYGPNRRAPIQRRIISHGPRACFGVELPLDIVLRESIVGELLKDFLHKTPCGAGSGSPAVRVEHKSNACRILFRFPVKRIVRLSELEQMIRPHVLDKMIMPSVGTLQMVH